MGLEVFPGTPKLPHEMIATRNPAFNLPRGFKCAMCEDEIREEKFGDGFPQCGAFVTKSEYPLCARCVQIVARFINIGADKAKALLEAGGH